MSQESSKIAKNFFYEWGCICTCYTPWSRHWVCQWWPPPKYRLVSSVAPTWRKGGQINTRIIHPSTNIISLNWYRLASKLIIFSHTDPQAEMGKGRMECGVVLNTHNCECEVPSFSAWNLFVLEVVLSCSQINHALKCEIASPVLTLACLQPRHAPYWWLQLLIQRSCCLLFS